MGLETRDNENSSQSQDAALSAELRTILDTARQAIEDEFRKRLAASESDREQALSEARLQLSEELRRKFDETLQQTTLKLEAESAQRMAEFAQRMTETAA